MRKSCLLDDPDIWNPGGLPSALDAVLSTFQRPGVVVIDTWWSRTRFATDNDDAIQAAIAERLENAAKADIPIITAAGMGLDSERESVTKLTYIYYIASCHCCIGKLYAKHRICFFFQSVH